mgnify:CR=1 FL=1
MFHALAYVTTISSPIMPALAPGIELTTPVAFTPVSSIIRASVIGPCPAAFM